jgi:hypothetical protein
VDLVVTEPVDCAVVAGAEKDEIVSWLAVALILAASAAESVATASVEDLVPTAATAEDVVSVASADEIAAAAPINHVVAVECNDDISRGVPTRRSSPPVPTSVAGWLWQFAPRAFPARPKKTRAQIAAMASRRSSQLSYIREPADYSRLAS